MIKAQSDFKNMIRKKRYIYDKPQTEKLISTKYDNAKAYWRLLKHASNQNVKHSISAKQFAEYLKAINDPDGRYFQVDEDIHVQYYFLTKDKSKVNFKLCLMN